MVRISSTQSLTSTFSAVTDPIMSHSDLHHLLNLSYPFRLLPNSPSRLLMKEMNTQHQLPITLSLLPTKLNLLPISLAAYHEVGTISSTTLSRLSKVLLNGHLINDQVPTKNLFLLIHPRNLYHNSQVELNHLEVVVRKDRAVQLMSMVFLLSLLFLLLLANEVVFQLLVGMERLSDLSIESNTSHHLLSVKSCLTLQTSMLIDGRVVVRV